MISAEVICHQISNKSHRKSIKCDIIIQYFLKWEILPRWLKYKVIIKHKLNCITCFTGGKLAKGHHKILFACLYDTYSQYDGYENN